MPNWRMSMADVSPSASPRASASNSMIDAIESDILAVLRQRLALLGPEGSGLGPYYARQIEAGQALNPGDRMLVKLLATEYLDFDQIVEPGAGYGQLGLVLAACGRKVHLVEAASERVACIEALKAALLPRYPAISANATVEHGRWPGAPTQLSLSRALLVAVDFVFTASEQEIARAMEALNWYGGAIFDGSHFIETRLTPEKRAEFYDELSYRGLSAPLHLPTFANVRNSEFVFVSPRRQDARHLRSGLPLGR